ncbi:hypothetical protein QBC35DRAFT_507777 [Podospora australis]|uniref:Uncharacterized protein n=1 Tax=Podospora australis TaxID=1536484 RepID=A0AAN6WK89_9PEZI|nr:hypothetical protein QBC35DRAFT_507777 [Podospora australis]
MCLSKLYYNTYSDGTNDVTEKRYDCDRRCSHPEVRKYDRKFPFTKLPDSQPESHRSLSERKPTPYFEPSTSRGSKSPSPSSRRDSGVYMGSKYDSYDAYDPYGLHHRSSRHDPRDRYSDPREPRLKKSSTIPQIVYMDRDSGKGRSRSNSRDYSRDIPLGVSLADDYGRRKSSSRSRSRDDGSDMSKHYRRRHDDPSGYMFIDDQDERRRQRRERRMSSSSYHEPSTSAAMSAYDTSRYIPRRASTVVHNSDGTLSTSSGPSSTKSKTLRWEDEVRAKRSRQNAEIANRAPLVEPKGILKKPGDQKGKGREQDDIYDLRQAVERMEIPPSRGRDRSSRDRGLSSMDDYDVYGGYDGGRRSGKRNSKSVYGSSADDRYRY